MPAAAMRIRANRSVALVTTVHRSAGNAASRSSTPGSTVSPSLSPTSMSSITFNSACVIEVRPQLGDRLDGATAMRGFACQRGIDAAQKGPFCPTALDRANGRNENSVHVKENAFAMNSDGGGEFDEAISRS